MFDSDHPSPSFPSPRSSQPSSQSCLTTPQLPNQYYSYWFRSSLHLPATICPPPLPPLPSIPSSSYFPLSRIHLRQGTRARLLKSPDESATTTQLRQRCPNQKKRESGRIKNTKSTFRLVGAPWSPRGPSVVNNR